MNAEPLHPDLRPFLQTGQHLSFPVLKHPLVFMVPYWDAMAEHANRSYSMKSKLLEESHAAGNWGQILALHERPFRLNAFLGICDEMKDSEYWHHAGDIWTDSENIYELQALWFDVLSASRGQREFFMDAKDRTRLQKLPDEFIIYRGATVEDAAPFSWTLDKDKAIWFSERSAGLNDLAPVVYEAKIKSSDVFAVISGRGESEIIIEPDSLQMVLEERTVLSQRARPKP